MNMISVQNLYFSYQDSDEIFKGLNLTFNLASTAVIGQNGAGKTTLVKLLKGLLKPSSGIIRVMGEDTRYLTVAKLAKHIGLVFQNPSDQIFKTTIMDEVMFGPLNLGYSLLQAEKNSLNALELVGLANYQNIHPYDLNLSERKLISIASIIAMDNAIIILDEPTIAQDYIGKERIKQIFKKLEAEGRLVITITHDMDFVAEIFKRTIILQHGLIVLDGDTRSVFENDPALFSSKLELPHVTQLSRKLGLGETFLTVEEFISHHNSRFPAKSQP